MRVLWANKVVINDISGFPRTYLEGAYYRPFCRYVTSDWEAEMLISNSGKDRWHWSAFTPYEKRYGGQDLNGKTVVIYRHNAIGDQLIVSSVPAELKRRYPDATIHIYCSPRVLNLWDGNPYIDGSALPIPIPFDIIKHPRGYDYHIFYEGMLENNSEYDQECCYDDFFNYIQLFDVPPEMKKPCIQLRPEDYMVFDALGLRRDMKYIVYHMSPNNRNRCYPPEHAKEVLTMLAKQFKDHYILVVGQDDAGEFDWIFKDQPKKVVNMLSKTRTFRDLIPVVYHASLVIAPDSSVMHLAGAFDHVKCISLWGLFHPDDRVKYYANNFPIYKKDACPYAPCRDHNFFLPVEQCKDALGAPAKDIIKWCQVLNVIEPEEILEKAKEVME